MTSAGSFDPDGTSLTYLWFEECPYAFFDDPTAANCNFLIDLELNCTQTCLFELRVFSGGQLVKGFTQATVQDTTAPLITIPADVVAIWVDPVAQTDPLNSGFASAVDCDPNPVIAYTDVAVANTMAGEPELVVTRTWTADDNCLHQSSGVQTITLLSPSGGMGGLLDLAPGSCPNELSASATGVVSLVLFGANQFDVSQIDRTTLELRRADNIGAPVRRAMTKMLDKGCRKRSTRTQQPVARRPPRHAVDLLAGSDPGVVGCSPSRPTRRSTRITDVSRRTLSSATRP